MPKTLKESAKHLFEVADAQSGYFTARQALEAGYSDRMQTYHVQAGDWEREARGIYRLRLYPNPRPDDLMLWFLWSSNRHGEPQAVYSHDTALELHELSTWVSSHLHMVVPRDFRRATVPNVLILHKGDLRPFETTYVRHVAVTTPVKTILDLAREDYLQRHYLIEAMQTARKRGLIVTSDLTKPWLSSTEKKLLQDLESESFHYSPEA